MEDDIRMLARLEIIKYEILLFSLIGLGISFFMWLLTGNLQVIIVTANIFPIPIVILEATILYAAISILWDYKGIFVVKRLFAKLTKNNKK